MFSLCICVDGWIFWFWLCYSFPRFHFFDFDG
jgi:hypothetical protein